MSDATVLHETSIEWRRAASVVAAAGWLTVAACIGLSFLFASAATVGAALIVMRPRALKSHQRVACSIVVDRLPGLGEGRRNCNPF